MKHNLLRRSAVIPFLGIIMICLSGCYTSKWADGSDYLTIRNEESLRNVLPYIKDTTGLRYYSFDAQGRVSSLVFSDDTDGSWHCYDVVYFLGGNQTDIFYWDEKHSFYQKTSYLKHWVKLEEYVDSLYSRKQSKVFPKWIGDNHYGVDRKYEEVNGKVYLSEQDDSADANRYREVQYYQDGTIKNIWHYYKGGADGEANCYYPNGKLRSHFVCDNDKIISVEEYEPNGNQVAATNVIYGNGRWVRCTNDESGAYCCDCSVVNGLVGKCKKLAAAK